MVLNGAFDNYGRGKVSNILKGFNFADMDFDVDGHRLYRGNINNFKQTLDMQNAIFTTSFTHEKKVALTHELMALRHLPYTALSIITVTAMEDITITPASVITSPDILCNVHNFYALIDRPHAQIPLLSSVGESPTGKHTVAASNAFIFEEHDAPELIHEDWDQVRHLLKFRKKLKKRQNYTFSVVGSVCSSAQFDDPANKAKRLTVYAMLEGKDRLLKRHRAALWQSDVIIEGDIQSQRAVHSALYHLYSFARKGTAYSLSPMGLSGLGYNGHVFWDTEIWMYPPLLVLQPEIARSLLEYRYKHLEAARRNAFSHGYGGAMFPWESDDTGQEATPVWVLTGPFEHHISGCIAHAFWSYYQVTKNSKWLEKRGYPVLKEIADFWTSRVEKAKDNKLHINNVVGGDEWAENVDDNAFTNGVAITALRHAVKAAKALGVKPNPNWLATANNIPILTFAGGTTREHASYNGEPVKQADVNLLAHPLKIITDKEQIEKNLKYYVPKIGHGPAMSHSVFSTLYSRLGDAKKAFELFVKGYQPNENPPFGVLAESAGGTNPYFATGAGGMLQAVVFGFGGLDLTDEGIIQVKTQLPEAWKSLKITGVGVENKVFQVK